MMYNVVFLFLSVVFSAFCIFLSDVLAGVVSLFFFVGFVVCSHWQITENLWREHLDQWIPGENQDYNMTVSDWYEKNFWK